MKLRARIEVDGRKLWEGVTLDMPETPGSMAMWRPAREDVLLFTDIFVTDDSDDFRIVIDLVP